MSVSDAVGGGRCDAHLRRDLGRQRAEQLLVDCDGIEDARTRGSYTSRILDIVQQIYKLKLDIAKILLDTRDLQNCMSTPERSHLLQCSSIFSI